MSLLLHAQDVLNAVVSASTALIGLFLLIPGDQPESFLQKIVDMISKVSRK